MISLIKYTIPSTTITMKVFLANKSTTAPVLLTKLKLPGSIIPEITIEVYQRIEFTVIINFQLSAKGVKQILLTI